jgi:hypothetical protein
MTFAMLFVVIVALLSLDSLVNGQAATPVPPISYVSE